MVCDCILVFSEDGEVTVWDCDLHYEPLSDSMDDETDTDTSDSFTQTSQDWTEDV